MNHAVRTEIEVLVRRLYHVGVYNQQCPEDIDINKIVKEHISRILLKHNIWLPVHMHSQESADSWDGEYYAYFDIGDNEFSIYFGGCGFDGDPDERWEDLGIRNPFAQQKADI